MHLATQELGWELQRQVWSVASGVSGIGGHCRAGIQAQGVYGVYTSLPRQGKAWPVSTTHMWKVSSEQSFQSLTPAQKYVSVMWCVLIISSCPRIWFWQSELWDAWHYFPASLDNKLIKLFHCVTVFFFRKLWLVEVLVWFMHKIE